MNDQGFSAVPPPRSSADLSRLAYEIAKATLEGFDRHYRIFREISREARARFELADWKAVHLAHADRIAFYDRRVVETTERLTRDFDAERLPEELWSQIKLHYVVSTTRRS